MTPEERPGPSLTVAAVAVVVFLQIPVLVVVLASFSKTSYLTIPPQGFTTQWFWQVLQDPEYLKATWTSLWLAGASTAASLVLGLASAYAIHHRMVPGSSLLASLLMYMNPQMLHWTTSGDVIIMTLLGGSGTLWGATIGVLVFEFLKDWLSSWTDYWYGVLGVIFMLVTIFVPRGIVGELARAFATRTHKRSQRASAPAVKQQQSTQNKQTQEVSL